MQDLAQLDAYQHDIMEMEGTCLPPDGGFPSYLVCGEYYTKLKADGTACDWQYVFEHLIPDEIAPFMYEMCALPVIHWNL